MRPCSALCPSPCHRWAQQRVRRAATAALAPRPHSAATRGRTCYAPAPAARSRTPGIA
jgi:hypothetical protein